MRHDTKQTPGSQQAQAREHNVSSRDEESVSRMDGSKHHFLDRSIYKRKRQRPAGPPTPTPGKSSNTERTKSEPTVSMPWVRPSLLPPHYVWAAAASALVRYNHEFESMKWLRVERIKGNSDSWLCAVRNNPGRLRKAQATWGTEACIQLSYRQAPLLTRSLLAAVSVVAVHRVIGARSFILGRVSNVLVGCAHPVGTVAGDCV